VTRPPTTSCGQGTRPDKHHWARIASDQDVAEGLHPDTEGLHREALTHVPSVEDPQAAFCLHNLDLATTGKANRHPHGREEDGGERADGYQPVNVRMDTSR